MSRDSGRERSAGGGHLRRIVAGAAVLALLVVGAGHGPPAASTDPPPLGIVFMIGDGMGWASLAAARAEGGALAMEALPHRGAVRTTNVHDEVTDSGAAATALATGTKTYDGAISVAPDSTPLVTVLEVAESRSMATGLVATSSVTHATPAAFAAHVPDRSRHFDIADQMARAGVEALFGGGARYFRGATRPDGVDLVAWLQAQGCRVVAADGDGEQGEMASGAPTSAREAGFYAEKALPAVDEGRRPSLTAMARRALDLLLGDPDGFFLMVEGSQIDWAGHAHDLPWHVAETRDFDATVEAVASRLADRPNTILVVTADHETGGLRADTAASGRVRFHWTTTGHTKEPVPLFARNTSPADLPSGTMDNTELAEFLFGALRDAAPTAAGR